jgi:aminomethyltransferase
MVDFAGWSMPVQYGSIIEEHTQTRTAAGIFDVSHMGRFYFDGENIDGFLDTLTTRRVAGMNVGRIRYSLMTNENGTILDDVLVYRLGKPDGSDFYMMVVNASNRDKIAKWITAKLGDHQVTLNDRTTETAMIAVQGPKANEVVSEFATLNPADLKYYTGTVTEVCGNEAIVTRTGYTGEDGCEIICEGGVADEICTKIHERVAELGGGPAGLGARDTLRLEAAMPLYGHELSEEINAAQTDLGFAMNFKDRQFSGRKAILAAKKDESLPVRVGLELEGRRAARENCDILIDGEKVGYITSGTFGPTLQKAISMGYINKKHTAAGTQVTIDIRGKSASAKIVGLPFYSRS